jgi:hypothetical protein
MTIWLPFQTLEISLGFPLEIIIMILVTLGGFIFYAKDYKTGLLLHFLAFAGLFIWFYEWSQTDPSIMWTFPLVASLVTLILLALSLYSLKSQNQGGYLT